MQYKNLIILSMLFFLFGCKQKQKQNAPPVEPLVKEIPKVGNIYKQMKFDNKKDFICEMPVTAGVSDTAQYKGKVYGFCATECKEEFLKNPEQYLTSKK